MRTKASAAGTACRNCGAELAGPYCAVCGQKDDDYHRPLWTLATEMATDVFGYDSRLWRTLVDLLRRPARPAALYAEGRRQVYAPPLRFYLVVSVLFFLVASLTGNGANSDTMTVNTSPPDSAQFDSPVGDPDTAFEKWLEDQVRPGVEIARKDPDVLGKRLSEWMPRVMFAMVPVLAIILSGLYLFLRPYFIDHLVFSFYMHAGMFLWLILISIAAWTVGVLQIGISANTVGTLLSLWLFAYSWSAVRGFYGQSALTTTLKWIAGGLVYLIVLLVLSAFAGVFALTELASTAGTG